MPKQRGVDYRRASGGRRGGSVQRTNPVAATMLVIAPKTSPINPSPLRSGMACLLLCIGEEFVSSIVLTMIERAWTFHCTEVRSCCRVGIDALHVGISRRNAI
jgi:hypothetical protein